MGAILLSSRKFTYYYNGFKVEIYEKFTGGCTIYIDNELLQIRADNKAKAKSIANNVIDNKLI